MLELILYAFLAVQIGICFYLLLPFLFVLTSSLMPVSSEDAALASGAVPSETPGSSSGETGIACVITAYKEKEFAFLLVDSLLKQSYSNYRIFLVADRCEAEENDPFNDKLSIIYPEKPLDSKVSSLRMAMSQIDADKLPYTLVFDPDNLAHPEYLAELNAALLKGYKAVQTRRTAKNLNTNMACIDAAGEHYYHITQRLAPFRLGSSATIAGSGMAIETSLYSRLLDETQQSFAEGEVIVAEDKILQNHLVMMNFIIAYAPNAILYDEKVVSAAQVQRQRTRWINSWFGYFKEALALAVFGVKKLSSNALLFGLMISTPPLFLLLLAGAFLALLSWFLTPAFAPYMSASVIVFGLTFMLSLYMAQADRRIWKALFSVPLFISRQLLAMLNIKKANTSFMETTHEKRLTIEEVMADIGVFKRVKS
ncbi:MAG: glycosyltransferase family 2 protein [Candidatus Cyclonatronum sp.]|uniref:glycosyltransferase n=1 Tax=Cyclonatronum sp. TaxID=3024185 RepID=UPI0025BF0BDE|nr:glycosyltransferase [Cyclonatronum sp.]MCH8486178.1 glycosyltransferase family 2 protein [Cyclonatronum sp.]